jgi:glycosyltransferase involved in cell wall biosynthesis
MRSEHEFPLVSVLLPAWNEAGTLGRCLDSLLAIQALCLEVIVCAGGTDDSARIARQYSNCHIGRIVSLEQQPGEGKQRALRRCFELSRGEIIYLTDADCIVPRKTLQQLVAEITAGRADATTGPAHPFPEQRDQPWVRHQWATTRAVDRTRALASTGILGRNCAVSREAIEAAGAFLEQVRIGTDYHFAKELLKAGRSIHYVDAPVHTRYASSFGPYQRQQSRWIRNILIHGRRFGAADEIRSVARTIALGAALLAWPLTWRWTRLPGVLLWLAPLAWMTRVRVRHIRSLEAEFDLPPATELVPVAALFSIADLIVWARPLFDYLISRRRFRW